MKDIRTKFSIAILLVFLFSGCKEFLEEEAFSTFTSSNFPQTEGDALALVNTIYNQSAEIYGNRYLWLSELPSEMVATRRTGSDRRAQLDNYTVVNTNDYSQDVWEDSYITIKQANSVITILEGGAADLSDALRARLIAEAKIFRANAYFNLVVFYGDIVLITDQVTDLEGSINEISLRSEVYEVIIRDLTEGEADLPADYSAVEDQGRVTRGGARALLGKVYLQRASEADQLGLTGTNPAEDYQNALNWLRLVDGDGENTKDYTLESSFRNLFGLENIQSSKNSEEIVMQLWRDQADDYDVFIHQHIITRQADLVGSVQWGNLATEIPFYLSFAENDERFQVSFLDTITTELSGKSEVFIYDPMDPANDNYEHDGVGSAKYIDPSSTDGSGSNNIFLIRLADVMLMIAEAANEVNNGPTAEAYEMINAVHERSTGEADFYNGLDYNAFRTALYNERRWELYFEGHGLRDGQRFFSIFKERVEFNSNFDYGPFGRRDDGKPDGPITVTTDNVRFPIPLAEFNSNPALDPE